MSTERMMTLDEYVAVLPESHVARVELTRLRTALAAAERAGAERALRWAAANRRARQEDNETFRTRGISALFPVRPIPPPGAEVGRG